LLTDDLAVALFTVGLMVNNAQRGTDIVVKYCRDCNLKRNLKKTKTPTVSGEGQCRGMGNGCRLSVDRPEAVDGIKCRTSHNYVPL
jgi:hypothetical protein